VPDESGFAGHPRIQRPVPDGIELGPRRRVGRGKFGWTFRVRDKVIQTENNYDKDVFNGDIARS
jgi:ATP-dependent exoDNAse (exonuclease V) alpha subunit